MPAPRRTLNPADSGDIALDTYRYLRGGMVVMIVLLAAAVIGERLSAGCWLGSISAYYYTAAHAVFIAALCATGAMMIVYRGSSDTEDALLNLAGILAFVVAFVPTRSPGTSCGATQLPANWQPPIGVSVWALVIALTISRIASWWLYLRTGTAERRSLLGEATLWAQRVVLAAGLAVFVFFRGFFDDHAHDVAAVLLFVTIVLTVVLTAHLVDRQDPTRAPHRRGYRLIYRMIAGLMAVTLVVVVAVHVFAEGFEHAVIVAETALVVEFAAYWLVQTVELWRTPSRVELIPEAACRERLLRNL